MADYSHLVGPNPEWVAFANTTDIPPTGLAPGQTAEELRQVTNASRETGASRDLLSSGLSETVTWRDYEIPTQDGQTIPARVYKAKKDEISNGQHPVYLFFHGGGYLFGSVSSEDAICARIVAGAAPIIVVSVCYRHTPQFTYPTQHNDAWDAFEWVKGHMGDIGGDVDQLVVGGISAGGGLAASVVLRENEKAPGRETIRGQVLCIPWIIHPDAYPYGLLASKEVSSYHQNVDVPVLPKTQVDLFTTLLDVKDPSDINMSVGNAPDGKVKGMPKTAIVVAGMDPLRDEALFYAEKLARNGIPTKVHIFPGLPHGFRRYASLPSSLRWDALVNESIRWCLGNDTASVQNLEGKIGVN